MCRLEPTRDGRARTISVSCGILRVWDAPTDHVRTALATDGPIFSCAAADRPHAAHLSSCCRGQQHRKIAPQPAAAPRWATVWPRNRCKTASQSSWPATASDRCEMCWPRPKCAAESLDSPNVRRRPKCAGRRFGTTQIFSLILDLSTFRPGSKCAGVKKSGLIFGLRVGGQKQGTRALSPQEQGSDEAKPRAAMQYPTAAGSWMSRRCVVQPLSRRWAAPRLLPPRRLCQTSSAPNPVAIGFDVAPPSKPFSEFRACVRRATGERTSCNVRTRSPSQLAGSADNHELLLSAMPAHARTCLLYTSPSPRDRQKSRMPSSA